MILDGKKLAEKITKELKEKINSLAKKPTLAVILANDNPSSKIYVNNKQKKCAQLGIISKLYKFEENTREEEITALIKKLNEDKNVNGILVQLPLFNHLSENKITNSIEPIKDVDGFCELNTGKLFTNSNPYCVPCTPKGIIKLLKEYNIELVSKNALVIGRSNIVGKPLAALLLNENATVCIAHSKTKNLKEICLNSDIIIAATGIPHLVTSDMVKKGTVVVDVGISKLEGKIIGDVDFENVKDKASYITPVPGGVGPMTIDCLM